jgi:hypothetical protein
MKTMKNYVISRFLLPALITGLTLPTAGRATAQSSNAPPHLTIIPSGTNLLLTWPTNNGTGFFVQVEYKPDLGATSWLSVTLQQPPIITNGNFVVTIPNPASNTKIFYRLKLTQ